MGKIKVDSGEVEKLVDGSNYRNVALTLKDSSVRLAPRAKLAESGKEIKPPNDVSLKLDPGDDLWCYVTGSSTAIIEVNPE